MSLNGGAAAREELLGAQVRRQALPTLPAPCIVFVFAPSLHGTCRRLIHSSRLPMRQLVCAHHRHEAWDAAYPRVGDTLSRLSALRVLNLIRLHVSPAQLPQVNVAAIRWAQEFPCYSVMSAACWRWR